MHSTVFRWSRFMGVACLLIAVTSCGKQEEAEKGTAQTMAGIQTPRKDAPPPVSSPPPTGQWKAVEELADGAPAAVVVRFDKYSSAADMEAVADVAKSGQYKTKIESFESHGAIMVGRELGGGGKSFIDGTMWIPNFVRAKQVGDTWEITIVSGSPFLEDSQIQSGNVGLIELTVPVKGEGGTARLYLATEVTFDKGQLIPKHGKSQPKVLKVRSFAPSENKEGEYGVTH